MACERVVSHHILKTMKVRIMVVDDDSTSLNIVSSMLKNCSDQDGTNMELVVFSVNNPLDALAALRMCKGKFDLVVSDLHMPEMNGMELQKHVEEEFNLPVIIMSSDDQESAILRSLEDGAAFYIVKPVKRNDLRNVWQYAISSKKGKFNSVESSINETSPSPEEKITYEDDNVDSWSSIDVGNNGNDNNVDVKKRGKKRSKEEEDQFEDDEDNPIAKKKAKVVWTNSLHNRFLQAINHIGLEKSVPKRILEFMNVPGLTRENVASHLQKYRIFLRRVADRGSNPQRNFGGPRRSNFASTFPPHNQPQIQFQFQSQLNQQPTFHPGLGWNTPATNRPRRLAYNVRASSTESQPSFRQSHLLDASNRSILGFESNSSTTTATTTTTRPYGLTMNAITNTLSDNNNPCQGFQLENQLRMNQLSLGGITPLHQTFESNEIERINPVSAVVGHIANVKTNNGSNPFLSDNYDHTALWVSNDGNLFESGGHPQSNGSNRIANNCQSLLDWLHTDVSSIVGNGSNGNSSYSTDKALPRPPTNLEMPNIVDTFNGLSDPRNYANLGGFLFDANGNVINNSSRSNCSNISDDENNYLVPNEQQGGERIDTFMPQLPSSNFPTYFSSEYNSSSIEQAPVNRLQGVQEVVSANFNGNANDNQMENFCSTAELHQGSEDIMDLELSGLLSVENNDIPPEKYQNWDELMDSLLGDDPL